MSGIVDEKDLPRSPRRAVRLFREKHPEISDPLEAKDQCFHASVEMQECVDEIGALRDRTKRKTG